MRLDVRHIGPESTYPCNLVSEAARRVTTGSNRTHQNVVRAQAQNSQDDNICYAAKSMPTGSRHGELHLLVDIVLRTAKKASFTRDLHETSLLARRCSSQIDTSNSSLMARRPLIPAAA